MFALEDSVKSINSYMYYIVFELIFFIACPNNFVSVGLFEKKIIWVNIVPDVGYDEEYKQLSFGTFNKHFDLRSYCPFLTSSKS